MIKLFTMIYLLTRIFGGAAAMAGTEIAANRIPDSGTAYIVEPDVEDLTEVTFDKLVEVCDIVGRRLDRMGFEYGLQPIDDGKMKIMVSGGEDVTDLITRKGKLEFCYVITVAEEDGSLGHRYIPAMDGSSEYVSGAKMEYGPTESNRNSAYYVSLSFTGKGREAFRKVTETVVSGSVDGKEIDRALAIVLDGEELSCPSVLTVIDSFGCIISGNFVKESAVEIAALISDGALPFGLKVVSTEEF